MNTRFQQGHEPANKKTDVECGQVEMYWRGCRCQLCSLANTKYYAERNGKLTLEERKALPCKDCGINPQMARCRSCQDCYNEKARIAANKKNRRQTPDEYEDMFTAQLGLCAICNNPETAKANRNGRIKELSEDHDHETGRLRELLCKACNTGIGNFNDDVELLKRAIEYIEKHKGE